jgi:hypothetical protein
MEINLIHKAATNPSGFGMPICGHLPTIQASFAGLEAASVVRDRRAAVTGDMRFAVYTQGTNAWRPPSS